MSEDRSDEPAMRSESGPTASAMVGQAFEEARKAVDMKPESKNLQFDLLRKVVTLPGNASWLARMAREAKWGNMGSKIKLVERLCQEKNIDLRRVDEGANGVGVSGANRARTFVTSEGGMRLFISKGLFVEGGEDEKRNLLLREVVHEWMAYELDKLSETYGLSEFEDLLLGEERDKSKFKSAVMPATNFVDVVFLRLVAGVRHSQ